MWSARARLITMSSWKPALAPQLPPACCSYTPSSSQAMPSCSIQPPSRTSSIIAAMSIALVARLVWKPTRLLSAPPMLSKHSRRYILGYSSARRDSMNSPSEPERAYSFSSVLLSTTSSAILQQRPMSAILRARISWSICPRHCAATSGFTPASKASTDATDQSLESDRPPISTPTVQNTPRCGRFHTFRQPVLSARNTPPANSPLS